MPLDMFQGILIATTLASGLVAGVFLTFSDFVMRSLGQTTPAAGIAAMQQINRAVYRSQFMVLLIGLSIVAMALVVIGLTLPIPGLGLWLLGGAASYILGVMTVTGGKNVPMNKRLDIADPDDTRFQSYWSHYLHSWTRWNHLRTLASVLATLCYLAAALTIAAG